MFNASLEPGYDMAWCEDTVIKQEATTEVVAGMSVKLSRQIQPDSKPPNFRRRIA